MRHRDPRVRFRARGLSPIFVVVAPHPHRTPRDEPLSTAHHATIAQLLDNAGIAVHEPPRRLSGGDMGEVYRVGSVVVKTHLTPPPGLFPTEARGLLTLAEAGCRVPRVHHAEESGLVIEWLAPGPPDWPAMGRMVAALHATRGATYGSETPIFLGRFPLPAGTGTSWTEVYRDLRIEPLLRATASKLGGLAHRLDRWLDRLELPQEGASLVHGDLWSGNLLMSDRGPALIDPSVQRAERGLDLAMMKLFGGFPSTFWDAYEEVLPIPAAVRCALPAHRIYFLLVHVVFFGSSYILAVENALDEQAE